MPEGGESPEGTWVQILKGSTFMISDQRGDVAGGSLGGLFHEDTRFLSRFALTVNGTEKSRLAPNRLPRLPTKARLKLKRS